MTATTTRPFTPQSAKCHVRDVRRDWKLRLQKEIAEMCGNPQRVVQRVNLLAAAERAVYAVEDWCEELRDGDENPTKPEVVRVMERAWADHGGYHDAVGVVLRHWLKITVVDS